MNTLSPTALILGATGQVLGVDGGLATVRGR